MSIILISQLFYLSFILIINDRQKSSFNCSSDKYCVFHTIYSTWKEIKPIREIKMTGMIRKYKKVRMKNTTTYKYNCDAFSWK